MGEKSSATEGSSIFESLFGGFSNGLSIFANNPFRRKNEVVALPEEEEEAAAETDDGFAAKRLGNGVASVEEADGVGKNSMKSAIKTSLEITTIKASLEITENGLEKKCESLAYEGCVQTVMHSEEHSGSSLKKAKRAEQEVVSEKKRRKIESVGDVADEENVKNGHGDSRKRKQDPASGPNAAKEAGLDDTIGVESKKKIKKKSAGAALDSEQQVLRQSVRNRKKRQSEDLLPGSGQKGRKLDNASGGNDDIGEKGPKLTGKRPQEVEEGEKQKKKTKHVGEVESEGLFESKGAEEPVAGASVGMETRLGSKRKKDSGVEELYERKRRETVDGKETTAVQGNAEQGGSGQMETGGDRLRGKRKLSTEVDEEEELKGSKKKKKPTREERTDNEERLKRTIFVGNLPVTVKTKQLSREFTKFGAVESARLRSVPLVDSKMPRKAAVITGQLNESRTSLNGYVVFEKEETARAALVHNMTVFNGKHLRVDMAAAPRKGDSNGDSGIEYDRARSIFVGNLPFDVEDEEVYSLFKGKSPDLEVEAVRVVRDPQTSIGKGFAFVCFKKKAGATTALDNAEYTRLRNRQLRIIRFGFQTKQKQIRGNLPARPNTGSYRSKPKPGAEERLSKRSALSYEGTRSSKAGGRPGKATGPAQTFHRGNSDKRGGPSKSGKAGKKSAPTKRPAVAARKLASQGNSGTVGRGGGKRKREEKGKKDSKGKRKMLFKK